MSKEPYLNYRSPEIVDPNAVMLGLSDVSAIPREEAMAIEVTGVRKAYREVQALRDVSFRLRKGEHLALLGPNGAGKTTLIRCLSGSVRQDRGDFRIFGEALSPKTRHQLGIVPQDLAIYPRLTARENLEVFGRLYGVRKAELRRRVDWALEWTDLKEKQDRPARTFSGGMKRRLNIAAGILHRPPVILLDEPTVGVDPQSRARIFEMLEELRRDGASLLLTTHQLSDVETYCDRIVIVDHGEVIAEGTQQELIEKTAGAMRTVSIRVSREPNPQVAGLSWNAKTNRLEAEIANVPKDLPRLLSRLDKWGVVVYDVDVKSPSLQTVFLKLTGRELRE